VLESFFTSGDTLLAGFFFVAETYLFFFLVFFTFKMRVGSSTVFLGLLNLSKTSNVFFFKTFFLGNFGES
jgi:hypothetical protein